MGFGRAVWQFVVAHLPRSQSGLRIAVFACSSLDLRNGYTVIVPLTVVFFYLPIDFLLLLTDNSAVRGHDKNSCEDIRMAKFKGKCKYGKRDTIDPEELQKLKQLFGEDKDPMLGGRPWIFSMTGGWACICFPVQYMTPTRLFVAHANHFQQGQKDYGRLAIEGADENCQFRYEGTGWINLMHVIKAFEYHGEVPRGTINSGE